MNREERRGSKRMGLRLSPTEHLARWSHAEVTVMGAELTVMM